MKRLLFILFMIPAICNAQMVLRQPFFTDTTTTTPADDGFPDDYIAYYDFSEDVNDATGNFNASATNLTYTTDKNSVANSAGAFNGTSAYVDLPEALINDNASWTFSFWVKATDWNTTQFIFGGSWTSVYRISTQYEHIRFTIYNNIDATDYAGTYSNTSWYNVIVTNASGTVYAYVNNNQIATASNTVVSVSNLNFGSYNQSESWFAGVIDESYWWDRVLSEAERTAVYEAY